MSIGNDSDQPVARAGVQPISEKARMEICLLLPGGRDCDACLQRLQEKIQGYRGVQVTHIDRRGDPPRFCVHYDPSLVTLDYIQAIAIEEGAHLERLYHHETFHIEGLDCADCARTLEGGVGRLEGVLSCSANIAAGTLSVEYTAERIAQPAIVSRIRALGYDLQGPPPHREMVFQVEGLDCADCAVHLEEALRRTTGVTGASVDFALARVRVTSADSAGSEETVERVASSMGYRLRSAGPSTTEPTALGWHHKLWRRRRDLMTLISGLLIAFAVALTLLGLPVKVAASLYVAAIVVGGYYTVRGGWAALHTAHSLDMNALMAIAAVGAVLVGESAEGAVAMFLFSLGNTLESYTMQRARNAIRQLMDLSPRQAVLLHGDREQRVAVEELQLDDRILVRPGERIAMDGIVLDGASAVNQAPVTGESIPVEKSAGSDVYAGTLNGQGALTLRVTRLAADTTIARIIKMVEEAQAQKAPSQRFVDRFARIYTPAVISVAAAIALVLPFAGWLAGAGPWSSLLNEWVYRALVLLVIACPCALVISTPVSIVSAIASAGRAGVLVKGGAYLEKLGSVKAMAFDKTGTLTHGQPRVVGVRCAQHSDRLHWTECPDCRRLLAEAAAVERLSEHPLALAVIEEAEKANLRAELPRAMAVEAVSGQGIQGLVEGHRVTVGTHTYLHETDPVLCQSSLCEAIEAAQTAGHTVMVVRNDCCGVRGYIEVTDTVRPGVPDMIAALRKLGVNRTVMLTGDNEATAQVIARAAGVDDVRANLLPEQKVQAIEALLEEYGSVAMVGDGVNDAPALARATVGIAMGAAGSDAALETSDVALMADDLDKVPFAVHLSRNTRDIILQNIVFALGIKALFFSLALGGLATLWMAVFADMGASLIVTLNGMRLLRQR